jgi:2-polyprenyl-3-methyl-5-hydroxy-6-metoxy-1,4-benzoquinol methylase
MDLQKRLCPVCNSSEYENVYIQPIGSITGIGDIDYNHEIDQCQKCGFIFANSLLREDVILKYYEAMSNYENHGTQGAHSPSEKNNIERQVDLICSAFPVDFKGRALDIGCSVPYGLSLLKDNGWSVLGADPSEKCVSIAKEMYDIDVIKGFFEDINLNETGKFDLIILSHVLEHLISPSDALLHIRKLLKDNGILYIEVPNLMETNNLTGYFTFEHINYFTTTSLRNILMRNGYNTNNIIIFNNDDFDEISYPVIGVIASKGDFQDSIVSDKMEALNVIANYRLEIKGRLDKINTVISDVSLSVRPGRLAIWGGGIHTSQLLAESKLRDLSIHCIYDNDPKKHGESLSGIPIMSFPNELSCVLDAIDGILITSQASENEIYSQLSKFEVDGLKIFRLYQLANL